MNFSIVLFILGWILQFEAGFLLLPILVGLIYQEIPEVSAYIVTALGCFLLGYLLRRRKPKAREIYTREGFAVVALGWTVMSIFGAIPFVLTKEIPHFIDALFETISGFTTTGASILAEVEALSQTSLFWRSFTHWIGGMGVFVFIMAILPLMGGSTINLMRAESPGPSVGKLLPKVKDTAKILYLLYLGITVFGVILLCVCGMPLFDSITTTFGSVGTGGFGIKSDSITSYSPLIQNAVTVLMILSGVNYSFYFFLLYRNFKDGTGGFGIKSDSITSYSPLIQNAVTVLMILSGVNYSFYFFLLYRNFKDAFSMEEVRWYFIIILVSAGIIIWDTRHMVPNLGDAARNAFFQVGSIITTTGFATTDFDAWPQLSKTILIILMFIGACAGSTGGGIKVSRIMILFKSIKKELSMMIHPRMTKKIRMDNHVISHETLRSLNVFIAVYFVIFFVSVLLVGVDEFGFTTNFTAVAATLNNIGPGLELVGPTQNFSIFSPFSKCILMFDMLAGRLELFPMLMVLMPSCWKKY